MTKLTSAFFALLLCALATPSHATILFAGGEDIDFTCSLASTCQVDTTSVTFRAAWAREAYDANAGSGDPQPRYFQTPAFSANSTIWIHARYCHTSAGSCSVSTTSDAQAVIVIDSAGNPTLMLRGTGTDGVLKISSRTPGGVFTDLATCSAGFPGGALMQFDLYIDYGTSGEVALYANSVKLCDFTGDVTNGDGATTLDQIRFADPASLIASGGGWSEVIIATTDTRAMGLYTLAPNGSGNATQWTGTNPCTSILNAITIDDANYVYTAGSGQVEECTVTNSIPPGSYSVQALVMSGRLLVGASGPQHFDFVTRTGGTDYPSADFAPTTSFSNFGNYVQAVNPATSNPWAVSDFTTSGFNIGLESKP